MKNFKIDYLDHVAIRVKDFEVSISWYEKTMGMEAHKFEEWGPFPIFMKRNNFAVALFPATEELEVNRHSKHQKIDHFAFHVDDDNFEKAQQYFNSIGEAFEFQDHYYYYSIYLRDPDDHTVELTTTIKNPK